MQLRSRQALLAIAAGGLVAGTLDLAQACILLVRRSPSPIAGGLLGSQAFRGDTAMYILGILLHRLHSCRRLLRSKSQTAIPGSARIGMRIILWPSQLI